MPRVESIRIPADDPFQCWAAMTAPTALGRSTGGSPNSPTEQH